jgi:hypothetical protein
LVGHVTRLPLRRVYAPRTNVTVTVGERTILEVRWQVVALIVGCGGPRPAPDVASPVSMVTSAVVMDACPDAARINTKRASKEIEELVSPCTKVPGGAAHFSATLLPGGRVELGSPTGDPAEGVVPTCLVQSQAQLKHRIKLRSACRFDVKLEEHTTAP